MSAIFAGWSCTSIQAKGKNMNCSGKKVLVIGTGLSGIGAAQVLSQKGASVVLLDQNEKAQEEQIRDNFAGAQTAEEM